MPICSFSKDFTENLFTNVENLFITRYLPEASGDAVRVYLYGLYLCGTAHDFDAKSFARFLKLTEKEVLEIFGFWEDCGLVQILSADPLFVEYLPVSASVGKPKPVRPEKYREFNRELFKILQRAGKDLRPYEYQKIFEFLENNPLEPQAFLLVAEYCAKKDGAKLSSAHILNKAEKLVREHKFTYEQVEADLADFNLHEKELSRIFSLLGIFRKPQEKDYDLLDKWRSSGVALGAVYAAAETLKKGSLQTLDGLVSELAEKDCKTEALAREYLSRREELASTVFKVARKMGVKVQNPRPYAEEYVEKWLERGYDEESLLLVAGLCMRLSYGFPEMDALLDETYAAGIVDPVSVKEYCAGRDSLLRLLGKIQTVCGVVKKTQASLAMAEMWRSWNFSDEMILEAAGRSAGASAPLPYINKLLSEWKRLGVFTKDEIPEKAPVRPQVKSEVAISADVRSDRERYYAALRERAERRVERAKSIASRDEEYAEAERILTRGEFELADAEIRNPEKLPEVQARLEAARKKRAEALLRLKLSERDFVPRYTCEKCSDTGFLPDGRSCDCYRPNGDK